MSDGKQISRSGVGDQSRDLFRRQDWYITGDGDCCLASCDELMTSHQTRSPSIFLVGVLPAPTINNPMISSVLRFNNKLLLDLNQFILFDESRSNVFIQ